MHGDPVLLCHLHPRRNPGSHGHSHVHPLALLLGATAGDGKYLLDPPVQAIDFHQRRFGFRMSFAIGEVGQCLHPQTQRRQRRTKVVRRLLCHRSAAGDGLVEFCGSLVEGLGHGPYIARPA